MARIGYYKTKLTHSFGSASLHTLVLLSIVVTVLQNTVWVQIWKVLRSLKESLLWSVLVEIALEDQRVADTRYIWPGLPIYKTKRPLSVFIHEHGTKHKRWKVCSNALERIYFWRTKAVCFAQRSSFRRLKCVWGFCRKQCATLLKLLILSDFLLKNGAAEQL